MSTGVYAIGQTSDGLRAIKGRAVELHGSTATVQLSGGQTLTGTVDYTANRDHLSITTEGKAHTVRVDHVSAIGQG
ncbi:hypothetical protein [Streptomyces buecherae]|uniref:hypothetical protein n=1 Tax=Streptomyces buecherae TaxID=2763006 RepID=UPI0037ABDFAB